MGVVPNRSRGVMRSAVLLTMTVLLLPLFGGPAAAYVRTVTCHEDSDPATDPLACRTGQSPIPVSWHTSCVVFHLNQTGSSNIAFEDIQAAALASFAEWGSVECSGMQFIEGGLTDEDRVGYNSCDPAANANILVFRTEGWRHQRAALALTSVTYDMGTGEIVDADIEFNDQEFVFTTTDQPELIRIDVRNTVTHEIGHMVGFDHTPDPEATMFATAPSGEVEKRDLAQDDIDAICDVYPTDGPLTCEPRNVGFFSKPSQGPGSQCEVDKGCGCRAAPVNHSAWAGLIGLLGLLVLSRRRYVAVRD